MNQKAIAAFHRGLKIGTKSPTMTPAEQLARAVLESHAAAYHVLQHDQFAQREKVIAGAAHVIEPILAEILHRHAEAICTGNPT